LALAAGALFGVGLVISGMTQPTKVIGFLDVAGRWDPSLLCVMAGAVGVFTLAFRWSGQRRAPFFAERFRPPAQRAIDARLIAGAALFGVGWGIGGYCPGPAVTSLGSGGVGTLAFVLAMLGGIGLGVWLDARQSRRPSASALDRTASEL
jgi:uncharacterized membrane protein YedE/YeeE